MEIKRRMMLVVTSCLCTLLAAVAHPANPPRTLRVGVVQVALEPTLAANRDKIVRFLGAGGQHGCRVVVFPETALFWPAGTPKSEIDAAVETVRQAVDASNVYALVGGLYKRDEQEKPF